MMQTPFVPSQVKRCPHFGDFQAWQLMHTRAIECSLLLFTVKKAIAQWLVLCVSVAVPGESCARGMPLSSEFCTVKALEEQKKCPLYGIVRCPHLGVFLSIVLLTLQSGPLQVAM